jgi:hypothetical protein
MQFTTPKKQIKKVPPPQTSFDTPDYQMKSRNHLEQTLNPSDALTINQFESSSSLSSNNNNNNSEIKEEDLSVSSLSLKSVRKKVTSPFKQKEVKNSYRRSIT